MKMLATILVVLLAFTLSSPARARRSWAKAEKEQAADLIVIGTVVKAQNLAETNTTLWPGYSFLGVETTFSVNQVLKGDVGTTSVVLHHFRLAEIIPLNGPSLLNLAVGDTNQYLMYLIKDGPLRYAPVAGQINPLDSIALNEMARQVATPQVAQPALSITTAALSELNLKCSSATWSNECDLIERPELCPPDYIANGEASAYLAEAKKRLAVLGVKVKWDHEKMRYEVENDK